MSLIFRLYNNTLAFLGMTTVVPRKSFFDYSSREKKRIIEHAAKEANRMQQELVDEYYRQNPTTKSH